MFFLTVMLFKPQSLCRAESLVLLCHKEDPAPTGDDERQIKPAARDSWMYFFMLSQSGHERLHSLLTGKGESYVSWETRREAPRWEWADGH